ncbi:putative amino acid permease 7 [Raphanus sativus]|uniref:Probable amino acid permease 7 n=1 Tax=Raphanus sativus TaxID=3726 RepID=A0A6J0KZM5_RAPSA|nr:probable amino acid permease 7 [Raphanus sativus]XP_056849904.1 probable amino acid permease 7 [Raphanus sativus]KAJ4873490.1 putative amino acid permease 7 [Raphanus sativus]KAJ4877510.1 putative amino acid permease 7 [Raphanus sativus]
MDIKENNESPVLKPTELQLHDSVSARTGTLWTAVAHIITGVIGAGVLSLAWATAELGWIGGPAALIAFAGVTLVSAFLLSDCYLFPDADNGPLRLNSYSQAVKVYLGRKNQIVCGVFVYISLIGVGVAYTIVTATCIRAIFRSNCYHRKGQNATCSYGDKNNYFMLLFGVLQIFMSQIPNFHNMLWLSVVAAIMSFAYSSIGLGLAFDRIIEKLQIEGSVKGSPAENRGAKVWLVFQALGNIAFSYPFSIILLEIQDTLRSPPAEKQTMKKASTAAVFITTFFYLCCGCFGYAAFGDATPGNLLTGFGFYEPFWLVDFANACIVLHLVGGYQVYSQPIYAATERGITERYPQNKFSTKFYGFKLPLSRGVTVRLNPMRLCLRTMYVVIITGVSMLFPYFNEVLGVLGALAFWPLAVYFPVEMCILQKKIPVWTRQWILLRAFSLICLLVSVLALVGSIYGLVGAKLR